MHSDHFSDFKSKLSSEFKSPRRLTSKPNYNNLNLYINFVRDYDIPEFTIPVKTTYLDLRSIQDKDWAVVIVSQGVDFAKASDYEKAIKKFDSAVDLDPVCIPALIAKGTALANTGEYKKAIKNFKKALDIDPKHSKAQEYLIKTRTFYNQLKAERESAYTGEFLMSTQYDSKSQSEKRLNLANDLFL
jgi:tetratricopeptide (TPR) repeat protein